MENAYIAGDPTTETPFFDTPTPFNLTPPGGGSHFPCGYTTNAEWHNQYLAMINSVSTAGILNGAACSDSSDCTTTGIDGAMYLLNSAKVVGIAKEDCMNPFNSASPPPLNSWKQTVATAIAVRKGGTDPYGRSFPSNKFHVRRADWKPHLQGRFGSAEPIGRSPVRGPSALSNIPLDIESLTRRRRESARMSRIVANLASCPLRTSRR